MRTKLMAIIAVMLMSISCMSISAYAFTGGKEQPTEVTETATPVVTEETDKSVNDSVQSNSAFTPKGNMGLVDDVVQDSETDEEGNYVGKQFNGDFRPIREGYILGKIKYNIIEIKYRRKSRGERKTELF